MTDLFLIAHKVRGEPAFDVAIKIPCSRCQSYESVTGEWCEATVPQAECGSCEGAGFTWQIPTSGHVAYPWWSHELDLPHDDIGYIVPAMPDSLPDHYAVQQSAPTPARPSGLAALLARSRPQALPLTPIARRGF